jgi:adenylate cyclase
MIPILNALFDAQAKAIHDHGGEILKFIGDGLLAIFPIEDSATVGRAATDALEAAEKALAAVRRLDGEPSMAEEPPRGSATPVGALGLAITIDPASRR